MSNVVVFFLIIVCYWLLACSRGELEETEDKVEVIFPAIPYPTSQSTSQGKKNSVICVELSHTVEINGNPYNMIAVKFMHKWLEIVSFYQANKNGTCQKNKIYTKIVILKLVLFYLFFSVFFFFIFFSFLILDQ